jgi:hypothetical protein
MVMSLRSMFRSITAATATLAAIASIAGCGIYTFSGSTLPSYIKTVEVPLFANQTLETGLAEDVTQKLSSRILGDNVLRPVSRDADATLSGVVTGYANQEYQYDIKRAREVDVEEYMVRIAVRATFVDNKKNDTLFNGTVQGQGIYAFGSEQENEGRERAIDDAVQQIMEKSVQSW